MQYIKNPMMIEEKSFEIIQGIIDEIRPGYEFKNEVEEKIIKRAIHTTADFDYLDILKISDTAVNSLVDALKNNATIYTDTNMALSGINKKRLDDLGCKYKCLVAQEQTASLAKEKGITRSMAAVEIAAKEEGRKIFVLGNAPTALYKVMEMRNLEKLNLDAVVGVPVGFVGAAESKDELEKTDIPFIISKGRKGGSNLAAAIINAILYSM
ncbi:cobalt-precorrin-8 methylmutase [Romboutsia maritimum]|uniref:Cobalt-precorrin-8 methylmutase n=1 Tax=Romboutsia maritimum TaxID=2020948 RepID=A0A371IQN3_9FIRM|nr:cobalt-precorrin-8 methylmutase [Romboutsia maritimum]RDY22773.1 cobalt-precorrin-8 methylmutase [Romboutsia maritimum]